jgi:uncharacterized membrane-anchored protein
MTAGMRKGLIVAAIHLAFVGSLGAKLLIDRATRPRVWARTAPVDPDHPLRGRYVQMRVEGEPIGFGKEQSGGGVVLVPRGESLGLQPTSEDTGLTAHLTSRDGREIAVLDDSLAYFIPEHVPDPSIRAAGEELWVEVTLPKQGPPRPIRLGVKKDGVLTPLSDSPAATGTPENRSR